MHVNLWGKKDRNEKKSRNPEIVFEYYRSHEFCVYTSCTSICLYILNRMMEHLILMFQSLLKRYIWIWLTHCYKTEALTLTHWSQCGESTVIVTWYSHDSHMTALLIKRGGSIKRREWYESTIIVRWGIWQRKQRNL